MYQERMFGYYPKVIQSILEFKSIINSEYPEFEMLADGVERVTNDAWLQTMTLERIIQWEKILGITPIKDSSESDRRETVIARIRGQGKLNTALINSIVNVFTGGTAKSWVADSILYVEIDPPPGNKVYQYENVKQELKKKIPAHLGFNVSRNYYTWDDIKNSHSNWQQVLDDLGDWDSVYLFVPFK
jgi:hypothetical protein